MCHTSLRVILHENLSYVWCSEATVKPASWWWWWSVYLPASEFRGQLGEEVGGCPGADMGQGASLMMGQGGWCGRGWVNRGPAVPQLSPVEGAANCGASGQAATVRRGRGGGGAGPSNTESGGRSCRQAVAQGAAGKKRATNQHQLALKAVFQITSIPKPEQLKRPSTQCGTCCLCHSAGESVCQRLSGLCTRMCSCVSWHFQGCYSAEKDQWDIRQLQEL